MIFTQIRFIMNIVFIHKSKTFLVKKLKEIYKIEQNIHKKIFMHFLILLNGK